MTTPGIEAHVAEREWLALVAGDLSEARLDAVRQHATACAKCGQDLNGYLLLDVALAALGSMNLERSIVVESPVGPLAVYASEAGICRVEFAGEPAVAASPEGQQDVLAQARRQLEEYFAGRRRIFDVPIDLSGVAPFQRQVLEQTAEIRFGSVATYGRLANAMGRPRAARAVGGALNRNPVPILIPCHRVVGATGGLVGYAGGIERKRFLLELEGALAA